MTDPETALRAVLGSPLDRSAKARAVASVLQEARGYHWVGLYDVTSSEIRAIAWTGSSPPAFPTFPRSRGLNGAAVATGQPVIVQDVRQDPRWLTTFGTTRAEAIFPVHDEAGRVVGTIDVESDRAGAFGPADETFLTAAAAVLRAFWVAPGEASGPDAA
jgi:L-methionine (R)-S-oxide reductase